MANTKSVVQQDQELPNMELPEGAVVRVHRKKRRVLRAVTFPRVMFAVLVSGLCVVLLYNNMYLTSLTKQIGENETDLANLQSEYVSLKARQEQALSISYVEQYAQETLGMVKLDPSQIEYIEMTNPEVTEVSGTATLGDAVANLMRSFTAVLEYLR